jgi:hypothetical protein
MGKIHFKKVTSNTKKQAPPPPSPTIKKVKENPVPSIDLEKLFDDVYKKRIQYMDFDSIYFKQNLWKLFKIVYRASKIQNGVETNNE